jgi:hypothetical protein
MKKLRLWMLLGGVVFLCAAFWFLNFRVAASNTQCEKSIITTGMGIEDGLPDSMSHREKINIILIGEDPLAAALEKALLIEMNNTGIGDIELVERIAPKFQSPVLIMKVDKTRLFWIPFFATSRFTIQAGYSSIGDTTFMEKTPITINNQDGPVLNMYGEYKVSDRSWGLMSRLGYRQILAGYLARQIVSTLKDLYKVST